MRTGLLCIIGMSFILIGLGILKDIEFTVYEDLGGRIRVMWKSDNIGNKIIQE
jgi:hypothetical protein